jgi:hypothetical protein
MLQEELVLGPEWDGWWHWRLGRGRVRITSDDVGIWDHRTVEWKIDIKTPR